MKKNILSNAIIFISFCLSIGAKAQTMVYSCNSNYKIELPNKLELQNSELNSVKRINAQGKKPQINISTLSGHITFQQKGLNADVKSAYNKYCRVMVNYYKEDRNDPVFGCGDQIIVDKDILEAVTESAQIACRQNETPFIKLISVESMTINGFPVLYHSYKRKGWKGDPPVIVNMYRIFNRYESVNLVFSYREAEREMWKDIHNYIIKTFNFNRKY